MDTKQATCAERIAEELKYTEALLQDLQTRIDGGESKAQEDLWELPLSIETFKTTRVTFSTGGPADWIDITTDEDNDIVKVTYTLQDWFDSATLPVERGSWLWSYADLVTEGNI